MSTWSGTRKKPEEDCLCPSLRGKVKYFAATCKKCPGHEGRAAILVDEVEVLKSSYYEYAPTFWRLGGNPAGGRPPWRTLWRKNWTGSAPFTSCV